MIRYEDVTDELIRLSEKVKDEFFPELVNVKIKFLFNLKKKLSNGSLVLGTCQKTNDLLKHFTIEEANDEEGFPYIIMIDKCAWDNITESDRIRLLRHEMRHIFIDLDAKNPYKILPHSIEDFVEEVEINIDDVRWASRVANLTQEIYNQRKDQESDEE